MNNSMRAFRADWRRVKFGDVVRQVKDKVEPETSGLERYVAGDHMGTDDLRIRRWGEIGSGYLGPAFHMRFRPGQVLYGSRRTYLRKVAIADFTGICANTTFVIETRDASVLLPEYLPFVMQTEAFHAHSIKQSKGSVNPYINFTDLNWFEFVLPPADEQLRRVHLLTAVEAERESLIALEESAITVVSSICLDMLKRDSAPRAKVGELASFSSGDGIAVTSLSSVPTTDAMVPVYGGNGIAAYTAMRLTKVPHKTIVIGRVGAYCGRTYFVEGDAWVSDNALYASSFSDAISPQFLCHCLVAANLNRLSSGGAQPLVNQQIVKSVIVPVPPVEEQLVFEARVRSILKAVQHTQVRRNNVAEFKRLVMEENQVV